MRSRHRKGQAAGREWPAVVYFWAFGLGILAYAVARVVLDGRPHPIHWLAALIGGLAGIPIGWLWFRWRGDLF
jgi:CHASE2 domain-containing sensor protein